MPHTFRLVPYMPLPLTSYRCHTWTSRTTHTPAIKTPVSTPLHTFHHLYPPPLAPGGFCLATPTHHHSVDARAPRTPGPSSAQPFIPKQTARASAAWPRFAFCLRTFRAQAVVPALLGPVTALTRNFITATLFCLRPSLLPIEPATCLGDIAPTACRSTPF